MIIGRKDKQKIRSLETEIKSLQARITSKDLEIASLAKAIDNLRIANDEVWRNVEDHQEKLLRLQTGLSDLMRII